MKKRWKIVGINFDHMHMGDLLRMAHEHPDAEIVGISDEQPERMATAASHFGIGQERQFADLRECLERTRPDVAILCPATGLHGDYVEQIAPYGVDILIEKPFAASLADADRMIAAVRKSGRTLMINWPLAWSRPHVTCKRLIDEGLIGTVTEVHHYGGNRGPLRHLADKVEVSAEEAARQKSQSWWYRKDKAGGSLQDYMGYGATFGTWYHGGKAPIEVTCVVNVPPGLEVDEHSITVARYDVGLSIFETRWGTFTDPWIHPTQPKTGFVIAGTHGTISVYDRQALRVQTERHPEGEDIPADILASPNRNPIEYLLHCLETGEPVQGPLDPQFSRIGQQIIDTAVLSAQEKRTVALLG